MHVKKRIVFFLCGFDRRGVSFYHRQYAEHAALQQRINQAQYRVDALNSEDALMPSWHIMAQMQRSADAPDQISETVHTRYHWLHWNELLDAHWPRSDVVATAQYLWFALHYIFSGAAQLLQAKRVY